METDINELIPVGPHDIRPGQRIPYDIYNTIGQLLVTKGQILNDHGKLLALIRDGRRLRPLSEAEMSKPLPNIPRPPTRPPLEQARILIAEDMRLSQQLLINLLTRQRIQVQNIDTVDNGKSAVERCCVHPYQIVFLDIDMPVMDGLTALAEIRAFEPGIFACLVTANGTRVNVQRARELAVNGFIVKPMSALNVERVLKLYERGTG